MAETPFSVMTRAAWLIAVSPSQKTGARRRRSPTETVLTGGNACTVWPVRVSLSRSVAAT